MNPAPDYASMKGEALRSITVTALKEDGRKPEATACGQRRAPWNKAGNIAFLTTRSAAPPVDTWTNDLFDFTPPSVAPVVVESVIAIPQEPIEAATTVINEVVAVENAAPPIESTPVKTEAVAETPYEEFHRITGRGRNPDLVRKEKEAGNVSPSPAGSKKKGKGKKGRVEIEGAFVPLTNDEQDSPAYTSLSGNASKVYLYLRRAARTVAWHGGGGKERDVIFDYSYSESKRHGFSESTFIRSLKDLWSKGFIDVIERGGLRGTCRTNSRYKLSADWKTHGKGWRERTQLQPDPWACTTEPRKAREVKW